MSRLFDSHEQELSPSELRIAKVSTYLFWSFLVAVGFARLVYSSSALSLPDYSDFFQAVGMNPLNASGLAGTAFLFLCARPHKKSFWSVLGLGVLLEGYYLLAMPPATPWHYRMMVSGPGLAVAGILGLCYLSVFASSGQARLRARSMFRLAVVYLLYPLLVGPCFAALSAFTPEVFDAYGYSVEGSLGFWPCNEVAMFIQAHPVFDRIMVGVYTRLPVFVMLAFTLNLMYEKRCYSNVFFGFIASGVVAWVFYPLLPMVGVDQYVGVPPFPSDNIPLEVPLKPVAAPANLPRTCFPSMHGAWILLPFFTVRRIHPVCNWFFGLVVFLTVIATLHMKVGHYLLDLVVSFPFAVAFMAILARPTARNRALRWRIAGLCLGYVVVVALMVRFFTPALTAVPYLTWGFFILGVAASIWAENVLARHSLPENSTAS